MSNRGREKPHHKDRFRLTISNHPELLKVLEKMLPYLIVKKEAPEEMISYINGKSWRPWHGSSRPRS
jgi:hypothetical protein